MPRIQAANIAEHVRQQEDAILGAAARLFAERGVAATDLGDIAEAVGLARSSLYRYFPDKDHILLRWFQRELEPVIDRSRAIATDDRPVGERLTRWLDFQLDFVADPDHDLAPRIMQELGAVSPGVQAEIAEGHRRVYGTLGDLVTEALAGRPGSAGAKARSSDADRDPRVVTQLLGGLVQAAGTAVINGADLEHVRTELQRSARAVLGLRRPRS